MNLIIISILCLSDAGVFGYCYELRGWWKSWLFYEYKERFLWIKLKHPIVPYYRLFIQWPLDGMGLYFIWDKTGWFGLAGALIAIFLCIKEYGFYIILGQNLPASTGMQNTLWELTGEMWFVDNSDPYWLKRPWFIFGYIDYSQERFERSAGIALIILIICAFVSIIFR